jgi:hypothetical protein
LLLNWKAVFYLQLHDHLLSVAKVPSQLFGAWQPGSQFEAEPRAETLSGPRRITKSTTNAILPFQVPHEYLTGGRG